MSVFCLVVCYFVASGSEPFCISKATVNVPIKYPVAIEKLILCAVWRMALTNIKAGIQSSQCRNLGKDDGNFHQDRRSQSVKIINEHLLYFRFF